MVIVEMAVLLKAVLSIEVMLLPSVTDVSAVQFSKDPMPMLCTELGITIDVSPEPLKASSPILVTVLGITVPLHPTHSLLFPVSMIALHPPRLSKWLLAGATVIVVRLGQKENGVAGV